MRFPFLPILLLALALPAVAAPPSLRVTGEGKVAAAPDMATLTLGVTHQARTAAAAMDQVSTQTAAVLARLRAAGIAERDQTSALTLSPVWSRPDSEPARQITGFAAANRLTVRVRALDALGAVLDQVIGAGANSFRGLSFGVQDPAPLIDEARRRAVADATAKAELYATAAGLSLGPVQQIEDVERASPRPMMREATRAGAQVPVAAGEVTLSASVTMVFSLGP
ncbi:uncharacterized protein Ga0609869_000433 [Rhodovulum iodosum]|uniref:DUF541 domain-containing protein n=1 Tax=Rhodovulum iodosum TaxID=68291 RepID=A0ABV3XP29_9RHOB|nr:SIMPL domain-containing protein [Rhodovulum robiginosum]RSK38020.1 DUF541 domain-containing protein [Rhodovulum robiginosum]